MVQLRKFGLLSLVTLFTLLLVLAFLMPFAYGGLTAFKDKEQIVRSAGGSILPMDPVLYPYTESIEFEGERYPINRVQPKEGITRPVFMWGLVEENSDTGEQIFVDEDGELHTITADGFTEVRREMREVDVTPAEQVHLEIFEVPMDDGVTRELAALDKTDKQTLFINPDDLDAEPYLWDASWRTLYQKVKFAPRTGNFKEAWNRAEFPLLFRNTLAIAALGLIGTLLSSICVAYAFARFPLPGKNIIFLVLIGTIVLPNQVRLIPTYAFFSRIHWTGTWLPLIVPHFFANAYNVFLLRQYFLTLPREMDEAAMIDGAGPFTILVRIIIPQSWPVIVAVGLFHFVFAWNDYFEPLIYLLGKPNLHPISVGIQQFNFIYDQQPHLIQATSLLALVVPVLVFFLAQRFFMRGVVITGVDK
jgi:multiple sugar transport system permease protein